MIDIIDLACLYFGRKSSKLYQIKANSWRVIRKELARVNIDSLVVEMKIENQSELIFPFIIKRNNVDEYVLVDSLSTKGLHSSNDVVSFIEFEQSYSDQFMILEQKPYVEKNLTTLETIIKEYDKVINPLFFILATLLLIMWIVSYTSILPMLSFGLLLSWYYSSFESSNIKTSPFCIERGFFSCKKSKVYDIGGASFSELGIVYFLGSILALGFGQYTLGYIIIALSASMFCLYAFYIQVFSEKKLCVVCLAISCVIFLNLGFGAKFFIDNFQIFLTNEFFTFSSYILVFYVVVKYILKSNIYDYTKIRDFNSIMSEWSFVKSVSKVNNVKLNNSEIVIGNHNAKHLVKLVIHLGCKHCPEALREMINLVLIDDSYCLQLYIKSDNESKDVMYYNEILLRCKEKKYAEVYSLFLKWKAGKSNKNQCFNNFNNLDQHLRLLDDTAITHYPSLYYGNIQISNFPRFENIKVSLINS